MSGPSEAPEEKGLALPRLVIPSSYVIIVGHAAGNSSTKAMKAYTQELDTSNRIFKKARKGDLMILSKDDLINVVYPHEDSLVISAAITDSNVTHIMIDTGSTADILYNHTFLKMDFTDEMLGPAVHLLKDFTSDSVHVKGGIHLPLMVGQKPT
ncbi:hypothetical protein NE237_008862 [Protea cynaroides]|uniref:Uncharacterized protein n=1 Tax=Protea cynaroides TaxID=273540 RepID=A0A9Q0KWD9_9MAGN|nr:hypothetical protein NE237_008862 [Protea cynaroides]